MPRVTEHNMTKTDARVSRRSPPKNKHEKKHRRTWKGRNTLSKFEREAGIRRARDSKINTGFFVTNSSIDQMNDENRRKDIARDMYYTQLYNFIDELGVNLPSWMFNQKLIDKIVEFDSIFIE